MHVLYLPYKNQFSVIRCFCLHVDRSIFLSPRLSPEYSCRVCSVFLWQSITRWSHWRAFWPWDRHSSLWREFPASCYTQNTYSKDILCYSYFFFSGISFSARIVFRRVSSCLILMVLQSLNCCMRIKYLREVQCFLYIRSISRRLVPVIAAGQRLLFPIFDFCRSEAPHFPEIRSTRTVFSCSLRWSPTLHPPHGWSIHSSRRPGPSDRNKRRSPGTGIQAVKNIIVFWKNDSSQRIWKRN